MLNNEEINAFDVLDLIWMSRYRWDCEIGSIVVESVGKSFVMRINWRFENVSQRY
jgi:hypothetical protein